MNISIEPQYLRFIANFQDVAYKEHGVLLNLIRFFVDHSESSDAYIFRGKLTIWK